MVAGSKSCSGSHHFQGVSAWAANQTQGRCASGTTTRTTFPQARTWHLLAAVTRMSDDPYADRKSLTFEQAEGIDPLPTQLQPKRISQELTAVLWAAVYASLTRTIRRDDLGFSVATIGPEWSKIMFDYHVFHEHMAADDYNNDAGRLIQTAKGIMYSGQYFRIFGFIQFVLRHENRPPQFTEAIEGALKLARAGYRIVDWDTIIPIASEAERSTLERAFADLATSEFHGARAHLREAGITLTAGDYTASIRESIHAVESVARSLEAAGKLSNALAILEKSAAIHGGLKSGFLSIYGYTSDEQGIRHPLIDGPSAKVDETDALFMIGACASFVSYLIGKARSAGLLKKKN